MVGIYALGRKIFHLKLDIEREIEMRNTVEIKEVFETIDKEEILSGINLQIAEGEIYGFWNRTVLENNVECMLTLSTITSGSIEIFGKKSTRTQRRNPKSD